MKAPPFYDRVVDVMEELFKFTLMVRDRSDYLVDRYGERKGATEARSLSRAANAVEVRLSQKPDPREYDGAVSSSE
jgi:arsenic resistance protein ArsH